MLPSIKKVKKSSKKTSKNEEFSYANPYQKSQKIMKKSWNFWFENQVKLSKISRGAPSPEPPTSFSENVSRTPTTTGGSYLFLYLKDS